MRTCDTCSTEFDPDTSSGSTCFKCKIATIGFSFVGGGSYGRHAFHNRTTAEVQREMAAGQKRSGREWQPTRPVYSGPVTV